MDKYKKWKKTQKRRRRRKEEYYVNVEFSWAWEEKKI